MPIWLQIGLLIAVLSLVWELRLAQKRIVEYRKQLFVAQERLDEVLDTFGPFASRPARR